jgi:Protein of unknown function (DUF2029).
MDNGAGALHKPAMGDFLRRMEWLGRSRALGYLRLLAILNLGMIVLLLVTSTHGVDRNGFLLGSDFISFWTSGRMLNSGMNPYDAAAHLAVQRDFFASPDGFTAFFYPPSFLPLCWPLGLLDYFPALAAWLLFTGTIYVTAIRQWHRGTAVSAPPWLLIAAFPAVPIVITHGQTAFLVAGMLGLAVISLPKRPMLAGLLFGLATIKPQLGLLFPVALLASHEWKAIVAACLSALVLAGASTLAFGYHNWPDWLAAAARARTAMEAGAVPFAKMVTPFAAMRLTGAPVQAAYAVQGIVTLFAVGAVSLIAWRQRWSAGLGAASLAGAPLATPFALDYDLVILAFPLLWLTGQGLRTGFAPYEKPAIAVAFILAAFARPLALVIPVQIAPFACALLFALIIRRATGTAPYALDQAS